MPSISRMQFLRGDLSGRRTPVRPPWALAEEEFVSACDRCGDCIPACEAGIISLGRAGYPEIDFKRGGCDFCGDCLTACAGKALKADYPAPSIAWTLKAQIGSGCLALNGITCRSCGDACETRAIRFQLVVGGRANPILDQTACNGCGECLYVCPNDSVTISSITTEQTA